jgi:hypothetical protein
MSNKYGTPMSRSQSQIIDSPPKRSERRSVRPARFREEDVKQEEEEEKNPERKREIKATRKQKGNKVIPARRS